MEDIHHLSVRRTMEENGAFSTGNGLERDAAVPG